MGDTYDFEIKTTAETQALLEYADAQDKVVENAKAMGTATPALERQAATVRKLAEAFQQIDISNGVIERTRSLTKEIDDLTNKPGTRTAEELERIETIMGRLRVESAEARRLAGPVGQIDPGTGQALTAAADAAAGRTAVRVTDTTGYTPDAERLAEFERQRTRTRGGGADLSGEASLAVALAGGAKKAAGAFDPEQAKELIDNTKLFKAELSDLLNLPGERTRTEIERITTAIDILRQNAAAARGLAGGAQSAGDVGLATSLLQSAESATDASDVSSAFRGRAQKPFSSAPAPAVPRPQFKRAAGSAAAEGMSVAETTALGTGMRAAGVQGGFFAGQMVRAAETLGVARLASLAFFGLLAGAGIAALAGVVGWLAKAAGATPAFQSGLQHLQGGMKGFSEELTRAATPLTNFIGKAAGGWLDLFGRGLEWAGGLLGKFNEKMGIPAADPAAHTIKRLASEVEGLSASLGSIVEGMDVANRKTDEQIAKMTAAAEAAKNLSSAMEALKLAQINAAEQSGGISPQQAAQQRLTATLAGASERALYQRNLDAANAEAATNARIAAEHQVSAAKDVQAAIKKKVGDMEGSDDWLLLPQKERDEEIQRRLKVHEQATAADKEVEQAEQQLAESKKRESAMLATQAQDRVSSQAEALKLQNDYKKAETEESAEMARRVAAASGDKGEVARLDWMKRYKAALADQLPDWVAQSEANAGTWADGKKDRSRDSTFAGLASGQGSTGAAGAENLALAMAAIRAEAEGKGTARDPITDVIKNTADLVRGQQETTRAVMSLKDTARPGYISPL